jgi:pimeloyl-ACP methyl ester carboxylesterase
MPYVAVRGTRLYYSETGSSSGRALLLLHAALQTSESMEPLRKLFEGDGYRIVAPDLRGHGRSANPVLQLSLPRLADDLVELMAKLGIDQPIVIGYSLGGTVALELARRGLVSGLVVMASRIHPTTDGREAFDPVNIAARSPVWAKQLAAKHEEVTWTDLAVEVGACLATWSGFTPADLATISCPTQVVQGDNDEMVPIAQARELAAAVPGARLFEVPRAKHPELLYRADAMQVVHRFVTELS